MNITQEAIALTQFPKDNHYSECYNFALEFIERTNTFTSEDLKKAYSASGNPIPKEPRVWGSVILKLRRLGLVKHYGLTTYKNPNGHNKPCYIWETVNQALKAELNELNFSYSKDLYELLQRVELGGISSESAHQIICEMIKNEVLKSQLKGK
jgi:hypothetical protein